MHTHTHTHNTHTHTQASPPLVDSPAEKGVGGRWGRRWGVWRVKGEDRMGREGQKIAGEHRDPQLAAAWREVCVSLSVFTYICM